MRWQQHFENESYDSPSGHLHSDSFLVVTTDRSLLALDARTGDTLWAEQFERQTFLDLCELNDRVLVVADGFPDTVEVRDARWGRILLAPRGEAGCLLTGPAFPNPMVVAGGKDGVRRAFRIPMESQAQSRPAGP